MSVIVNAKIEETRKKAAEIITSTKNIRSEVVAKQYNDNLQEFIKAGGANTDMIVRIGEQMFNFITPGDLNDRSSQGPHENEDEEENAVDFRLPVKSNPFFDHMSNSVAGKNLIAKLTDGINWTALNHLVLIGPSGCGKTSVGFWCASITYMIYLECPDELVGYGDGYKMNANVWSGGSDKVRSKDNQMNNYTDVMRMLFAELYARLSVLQELLVKHTVKKFTPLCWLLYMLNDGARHIHDRYMKCMKHKYTMDLEVIIRDIAALTGRAPIVMIDDLQLLSDRKLFFDGREHTLMSLVETAMKELRCPVIWIGTTMELAGFKSSTAIAKAEVTRELIILSEFT